MELSLPTEHTQPRSRDGADWGSTKKPVTSPVWF